MPMRVYMFSILLVLSFFLNELQAQTYVFGQLTGSPLMSTTGWNLNGNATIGDTPGDVDNFLNELILTNAFGNQSGGIFYNTPINLSVCQKWTVEFDYRIWGGSAADGLAFCFLSVPPTGFVSGGGVGIPGTANGLKVVLDTWNNCGGPNPELQIYSGIGYNECAAGIVKLENNTGNLNFVRSNSYQPAKITYDNGLITLFINNVQYLTANFPVGFTGYMGFTASTGGSNDQHSIRNVIIYTDQAQSNAGVDVTTCSNEAVTIGAAAVAGQVYSWTPANGLSSTTAANPVVSIPNTTGAPITQTYTVTTSLASAPGLCPTTDQIVVTIQPEYTLTSNQSSCTGQYTFNGQVLTQPGLYNDTLNTIHGCDSIVSLNLTIGASPNVNAGQNQTLCSGETSSIGVLSQPGYTYSWSPSTGLSATNVANPGVQLTNVNTGGPIVQTYTLTVIDNTNPLACSSTDQIDVTILPAYQNTIQDTLCNGGPFVFNGNSYTQTGIYIDSSQTVAGCDSITTLQIAISQTPVFNINDTLICFGEQVALVPQSNFSNVTYGWLQQNNTLPVISPNLTVSPIQTTSYQVTAVDPFLCNYSDNFTITVAPLPLMNLIANQTTLCAYDTLLLTASGAPSLNWSGPVTFNNAFANQVLTNPQTGSYQVVGTTQLGCQDSTAVVITINQAPVLQITRDLGICPGFAATIAVSGATNYLWNNPALNGTGGSVTPNQTTSYSVVGSNVFNCLDTASSTVTVYPQPSANFEASPLILTNDNPTVSFTSYAQNAATSIWEFGDGTTSENGQNEFTYTYPFVEDQTYTVTLNVESAEGCTDQSQVQIQIKGGIIYYIPNTFTPDGDALNNLFTPVFTSGFDPNSFHMTIFNRWGEPVFESYDPKGGWDGKIDIYDAPEGTYTYSIDFNTLNTDQIMQVTGHVLLMR
jgi:gliding motility-associated-like protein